MTVNKFVKSSGVVAGVVAAFLMVSAESLAGPGKGGAGDGASGAMTAAVWAKVAVVMAAMAVVMAAMAAVAVMAAAVAVVMAAEVLATTEAISTQAAIITSGLLFGAGRYVKCGSNGANNAGLFGGCKLVAFTQPHGHRDIIAPSTILPSTAVPLAAGLTDWPKKDTGMLLLTTQDMPPMLPSRPESGLPYSAE